MFSAPDKTDPLKAEKENITETSVPGKGMATTVNNSPTETPQQSKKDSVHEKKIKAARLSIISNSVLLLFKTAVGISIGSISIISEAIHSGIDLAAAGIAFFAVKSSSKPADRDHNFGHGKYENISGFAEALLIFAAAGWIIWEAAQKIITPGPVEKAVWGVMVMAVSSIVNFFISRHIFKIGKESDSIALVADALHLRTDVYTSLGVMAGLAAIYISELLNGGKGLYVIDPAAAIIVACLIIKAAYDLCREALGGLLDTSLPEEEFIAIRTEISRPDGILGMSHFHTRKAGDTRFVEAVIKVKGGMSVKQAHDLTDEITEKIQELYPKTAVLLHIEPCGMEYGLPCDSVCRKFCKNSTGKIKA